MSTSVALTIIAICQMLATIAVVIAAGAIVAGIFIFKKLISDKIDQALNRVQPILDQTKEIAEQAKETAEHVSEKVDIIMTKVEGTADKVTSRMDNVTAKVEDAVSPQAATVAGYAAAAVKAFQLFQTIASVKQATKAKD
jgi:predicted PurR-regulated permease PerM